MPSEYVYIEHDEDDCPYPYTKVSKRSGIDANGAIYSWRDCFIGLCTRTGYCYGEILIRAATDEEIKHACKDCGTLEKSIYEDYCLRCNDKRIQNTRDGFFTI